MFVYVCSFTEVIMLMCWAIRSHHPEPRQQPQTSELAALLVIPVFFDIFSPLPGHDVFCAAPRDKEEVT